VLGSVKRMLRKKKTEIFKFPNSPPAFAQTRFLPWFVMAMWIDEKTFYKKLELSNENSKSKITVYFNQTFYDNAKNFLEVQDKK